MSVSDAWVHERVRTAQKALVTASIVRGVFDERVYSVKPIMRSRYMQ